MSIQPSYLGAVQGASKQRTEVYFQYSEGAAQLATSRCTKSLGRAGSFAVRRPKAVRG